MMAIDPSTFAGYTQMQEYLDVEDFADYMLLHFYADAEDWPHHNGYAAANANSGDGKFRFFAWDQEIVLDYHGRAATRIDDPAGSATLFQKMRTSEEFRLLFADRVYKHCFNDGALSVAASQDRYRRIASWIDKAIVAESARWGDVQVTHALRQRDPAAQPAHGHQSHPVSARAARTQLLLHAGGLLARRAGQRDRQLHPRHPQSGQLLRPAHAAAHEEPLSEHRSAGVPDRRRCLSMGAMSPPARS